MTVLIIPANGETVSQKKNIMKEFETDVESFASETGWCSKEDTGFGICTFPDPVRFEWEPKDQEVLFELSDTADMSRTVFSSEAAGSAEVYNLLLGKQYWWRAGDSEIRTFFTEDVPPRWMFVDGTFNVRDLGGYTNMDGERIRQGLIYRGCELDGLEDGITLTDKGRETMIRGMGIRFDLDLRGSGEYDSQPYGPLGPSVAYGDIWSECYGDFLRYKDSCLRVMRVLSDPGNYPVYLHCAIGSDRTGTLVALLYGLLRMDYGAICREYEMSSLCFPDDKRSRHGEEWDSFTDGLGQYGDSFEERCYNYALSCGTTPEQIGAFRRILLEKAEGGRNDQTEKS